MRSWITSILTLVLFAFVFTTNKTTANTSSTAPVCSKSSLHAGYSFSKGNQDFSSLYHFGQFDLGIEKPTNSYASVTPDYNHFRFRRLQNFSFEVKSILLQLSLLETLYTLDQSKSYHSDKSPDYAQPTCDYYVFALRRIRI